MASRPWLMGGLVAGSLLLAIIYFQFDPTQYPFPRCPFLLLTGLYCPGCGSQRATYELLHGHIATAAGLNLLAVLSLPILALGAVDGLRAGLTQQPQRAALLYRPWLAWSVAAATIAFAVLRNTPGALGGWLAP